MQTSESIANLAAALALAQSVMEGAKKSAANPFFKSKYADLESVVHAIKAPFASNGLSYVQFPCTNDKDEVGVETLILHSSGEWLRSDPFYVPVNKADAQGFGSAITYCRRYSLAAAAGVAPEDDDGNAAAKSAPARVLPSSAHPANGEGQDLLAKADKDARKWLEGEVEALNGLYHTGKNVAEYWDGKHYTDEEKLMLSVLLAAPVRRTIKDQQREAMRNQTKETA